MKGIVIIVRHLCSASVTIELEDPFGFPVAECVLMKLFWIGISSHIRPQLLFHRLFLLATAVRSATLTTLIIAKNLDGWLRTEEPKLPDRLSHFVDFWKGVGSHIQRL